MPDHPTVGNLIKVTGGVFKGRIGYLLELDDLWARVRLSDGLLLVSKTLVKGI